MREDGKLPLMASDCGVTDIRWLCNVDSEMPQQVSYEIGET